MSAAARLKDLLMRMKRGRESAQVPKRDVLDAYGISEGDLMGRGLHLPDELGPYLADGPLGQFLQAENVGVRLSPKGAYPFSDRAHFDAVGGEQLPYLAQSGLWDTLAHEQGLSLGYLRFLDMNRFPRRMSEYIRNDPFVDEGVTMAAPVRVKPYGLYRNEAEGVRANQSEKDALRQFAERRKDLEELGLSRSEADRAGDTARLLYSGAAATRLSKTDALRRAGPEDIMQGLSFQDLLDNADLRSALNVSGYLPRSSPLYRKPLVLAKKHGGSV